ncbi:Chromate resistance exported protein [Rhabdaerophilaceae bacterium]
MLRGDREIPVRLRLKFRAFFIFGKRLAMPSTTEIKVSSLIRLIGTTGQPALLDVRVAEDVAGDPRRLPCATFHDYRDVAHWAGLYRGQSVVVICQKGKKLSHGVAAMLRLAGAHAESLAGGLEAWREQGGLLVEPAKLPPITHEAGSLWVTRARPKIDRIACPWLIRRFIDRQARFMFVAPGEVHAVAGHFGATPFDCEDMVWSHRGELCTFDVMVADFGLAHPALDRLARIVRGADTARLDLEPEAAGLLALSIGLSRLYRDDLAQLEAGLLIYDALYRWSRDGSDETHNWPSKGKTGA